MTGGRTLAWRGLAAAAALACAGCLLAWSHDTAGSGADRTAAVRVTTTPPVPTSTAPATAAPQPTTPTGSGGVSAPVGLRIASIGVATGLERLGLQPDGEVEVPDADPGRAGWYELGTRPGDEGSAVVLGHVDSVDGPAVFARLGELEKGDLVQVSAAGGARLDFEVRTVETYTHDAFPARRVYARPGQVRLNLVTCGGDYDRSRGGYQANVVVYTRLVGPSAARRSG